MQGGARTARALLTAEEERVRERSRAPSGGVGRDLPGPRRSLSPAERKKERDRRACCGGRDWAPYPKQAGNQTERQSVPPHGGSPLGPAKERARERESAVGKGLLQAHLGERGQRSTPKIASPTDWRELTVKGLRARVLSRARSLRKQAKRERETLHAVASFLPSLSFCRGRKPKLPLLAHSPLQTGCPGASAGERDGGGYTNGEFTCPIKNIVELLCSCSFECAVCLGLETVELCVMRDNDKG